ncbi:MAG: trypsin-like peptidase domain-containing protein [Clostridia bacterium]|nr:trypsin-like peptidase domain-containing protein [Clostridia bacterium]
MENFENENLTENETEGQNIVQETAEETEVTAAYETEYSDNSEQTDFSPVQDSESANHEGAEPFADEPINAVYDFEKVDIPPVTPIKDYKPMSKGLKVFAGIMAVVILMTASCAAGYFFGKNGTADSAFRKISLSLSSKPKSSDEMTAAEVYNKVNKSVVGITVYNKSGSAAQASGVIYSKDGYIVTNDHIYSEIAAPMFKIYDYNGNEYDADYVAGDTISDLALLKIKNGGGFSVPDFGNSKELNFGENVVAIGRPSDAVADSSITKGIISHTKRRMQTTSNYSATLIQTDSAINPGSSGGALVNMYGQIVGITSSKLAGVEYDSLGFAIPTTTMKRVVTELSENGKVKSRAKLGITYQEVTSITKQTGDYKSVGLYIASVSSDSDLYGKAQKGDIVTHVNGKEITRADIILDVIEESSAGDTIVLKIQNSKGKSKDYKIKLKANVGESSYSLTEKGFSTSETPKFPDNNGGTFDFPQGE